MNIPGSTLIIDNLSFDIQTSYDQQTNDSEEMLVYPNPASEEFFIQFPVDKKYEVVIMNSCGTLMEKRNCSSAKEKFDVDNYAPGLYFINAFWEGEISSRKLIIR